MFLWILGVLLLLIAYILIRFYLIPKRKIKWYRKILESKGYKVKELPFVFLGEGYFSRNKALYQKYGDYAYQLKRNYYEYDVVLYNLLGKMAIHMISPNLIKEFYSFEKTYFYPKYQTFIGPTKRVTLEGLVFIEGQKWKQRRKIVTEVFNFDLIKTLIPKMVQICNQEFQRFEHQNKPKDGKMNFQISKVIMRITSNVVISSFFGSSVQNQKIDGIYLSEYLIQIGTEIGNHSLSPLGTIFGSWIFKVGFTSAHRNLSRRLKKFLDVAESIVKNKLDQIQKNPIKQKTTNLIENLVKHDYLKNQNNSEFAYDLKQIVAEFNTFFIAGTDTSTHFTTMIIYYLIQNPRVIKKLIEEITRQIKVDSDITPQRLKEMKYLENVVKQTNRMYTPAPALFPRIVKQDHQICDFPVAKGTLINVDCIPSHYNPNIFIEPFQFRPQRWDEETVNNHPFSLTGFGGGARTCIGKQLALIETKIIVIKFLKRYHDLKLPSNIKLDLQLIYVPQKILTEVTIK